MSADIGRVASCDEMELDPALDMRNGTAIVVVVLIGRPFDKSLLFSA